MGKCHFGTFTEGLLAPSLREGPANQQREQYHAAEQHTRKQLGKLLAPPVQPQSRCHAQCLGPLSKPRTSEGSEVESDGSFRC